MPWPSTPLPDPLFELASRQAGLVSVRQCAELGVTPARLRRSVRIGETTSVRRGVLDLAGALGPAGSRSAEIARLQRRAAFLGLLAHGPCAVSTGLCALVLLGVHGAPVNLTPEVTLQRGDSRRPTPGIRVRRVPVRQWMSIEGFAVVVPEVALAQAVPEVDRSTAVALLDSALHLRKVSGRGLAGAHELARAHRGVAKTHSWWALADGRSESPAESVARLSCADAGYPPDELQLVVLDDRGRFLARVELAWRLPDGRWLLVEVDGIDFHSSRADVVADFHRQNHVVTAGTLFRRYTGGDAASGRIAVEVSRILAGSGWRRGQSTSSGPIRLAAAA